VSTHWPRALDSQSRLSCWETWESGRFFFVGWPVGSLRDKAGSLTGPRVAPFPPNVSLPLWHTSERLRPPLFRLQLRSISGCIQVSLPLFSGLRHVLWRDEDLRGTVQAACAFLEFGKAKRVGYSIVQYSMHHGAVVRGFFSGIKLNLLGFQCLKMESLRGDRVR
jgi:hypothetical protein